MTDLAARVRAMVLDEVRDRLELLSLEEADVTDDFDLVHSGVLDSMAFVDLLSALEDKLGREIEIGEASIFDMTTLKGLTDAVRASAKQGDD